MIDSFVEAQNNSKRMSCAGCVTLFKTRQNQAARFSFMPVVMKSNGLKTYRGPKRKVQFGPCSMPGSCSPAHSFD